jgi:segregation and condensation protein B
MPEQETEQLEEPLSDPTPNPFDTEIDAPEDGTDGDENASAGSDDTPVDDEEVADPVKAASEIHDGDVDAEDLTVAEEETSPGDEESERAEPQESVDEPDADAPARSTVEVMAIAEAIIFVSDEPITSKALGDIIGENKETIQAAVEELQREYEERGGGLQIREIAGGWQIATRTEYHEEVRKFLKTRPSAKLSLAALETLAVIAYKQPVTVPEILEIRGVQSASAIKTLLEKRLIVTKGHKETVGRPMMYGTSKDFLIQFGLKDLSDLPSIEDFEDLVQSS